MEDNTEASSRRPTVEFDHHSSDYAANWPSILREMGRKCPLAYSHSYGGMWVAADYESVVKVSKDDATFSSASGITIPDIGGPDRPRSNPIGLDPPEFFAYRRMLNPWFSPAAVERLEPKLREVVDACIDEVIETGRIDLVLDLANPVPAIMTLYFLGLPLEDWEVYARPSHEVVYTLPGTPERDRAVKDMSKLIPLMTDAIVLRRSEPRDDFITFLTQVEVLDKPLSDREILEIVNLVIQGGVDTTTALMSNALLYLYQNPEAKQRLIDLPGLRLSACEEFLRWVTPIHTLKRTVTRDVEIDGCLLRAGDPVLIEWAGANYDEKVFERPEEVILDRFPNRHLAFGVGIHRCIVSNIARTQFMAVLNGVLGRLPDYEVLEQQVSRYTTVGAVNGIIAMPATFSPGPRIGGTRHTLDFSVSRQSPTGDNGDSTNAPG
jgi:cytochrome P450